MNKKFLSLSLLISTVSFGQDSGCKDCEIHDKIKTNASKVLISFVNQNKLLEKCEKGEGKSVIETTLLRSQYQTVGLSYLNETIVEVREMFLVQSFCLVGNLNTSVRFLKDLGRAEVVTEGINHFEATEGRSIIPTKKQIVEFGGKVKIELMK